MNYIFDAESARVVGESDSRFGGPLVVDIPRGTVVYNVTEIPPDDTARPVRGQWMATAKPKFRFCLLNDARTYEVDYASSFIKDTLGNRRIYEHILEHREKMLIEYQIVKYLTDTLTMLTNQEKRNEDAKRVG